MPPVILAACFVNDLGTVLALGIVFAHFDLWLAFFGAATSHAYHRIHDFDPLLFSESRLAGGFPRCSRLAGSHCRFSRDQDGYEVRRHPALDPNLPLRAEGRDVHHAFDVDGTYLRNDFGAVWSHQSHHRPGEVYDFSYRGNRQRRGANAYRPA